MSFCDKSRGMNEREKKTENTMSISIAAIVGLGWGLALGLVDGLFALLEGDPTTMLVRRLLKREDFE